MDTCLLLYGSAGTGKTLILVEVLKIKYSRLLSVGRTVRILVTTFHDYDIGLLSRLVSHLVNVKNIEVVGLEKLCTDLDICYDPL